MKAKVIDILRSFSTEDQNKFNDFIKSDYFNKSLTLRKFYDVLLKYAPDFPDNETSKKQLFFQIYPGKTYNEARILNLLSDLYKLSEMFIASESFKNKQLSMDRYMLMGMNERKLDKFFIKNFKKIQNQIENTKLQDETFFKIRQEIEYEYYSFLSQNSTLYYLDKEPIQSYLNKFNEYFIIKTLLHYHNIYNTKYLFNQNIEIPFIDNIIEYIKSRGLDKNPAISIHYNIYMLIKERNEIYYYKLKDLMIQFPGIMGNFDTLNTYTVMINFCISQWRDSVSYNKFIRETFELYKYEVENKIYKYGVNAKMVHTFYYNTVQSGLALNELKWVEEFINNYYNELEEKHKLFTYNLCYASFHFKIRNYEKSLEFLNKIDRKHSYFNIKINSLTLQNYYELNLYENAFLQIDSYRHFLKENTMISEENKNREINFTNVLKNLLRIKSGSKKAGKIDLSIMKELNNTANNKWLFEKIEELERNIK